MVKIADVSPVRYERTRTDFSIEVGIDDDVFPKDGFIANTQRSFVAPNSCLLYTSDAADETLWV